MKLFWRAAFSPVKTTLFLILMFLGHSISTLDMRTGSRRPYTRPCRAASRSGRSQVGSPCTTLASLAVRTPLSMARLLKLVHSVW